MSYENLSTARHGIKNFKGRLEIDAPIERVAHVLFDPETQGRWIGGLMNVSLLEIDLELHNEAPWRLLVHHLNQIQLT